MSLYLQVKKIVAVQYLYFAINKCVYKKMFEFYTT
jgi:hypothetical protein